MKRDWELVREILLQLEALPPGESIDDYKSLGNNLGRNPKLVWYHIRMLADEGLIYGMPLGPHVNPGAFDAGNLTWAGHDLLAKIRSDTVWKKVKSSAKDKSVDLSVEAINALAKHYIGQDLGVTL